MVLSVLIDTPAKSKPAVIPRSLSRMFLPVRSHFLSAISLGLLLATLHTPCSAEPYRFDGKRLYDHISNPALNVEKKPSGGLRIKNDSDTHFRHLDKAPAELPGLALPGEKDGKYAFGLQKPARGATVLYLQYKMKQPKDY